MWKANPMANVREREQGAVEMPAPVVVARLTRRGLLAGSWAAVAGTVLAAPAMAQDATPVAVEPAAFRALCVAVTGSEDLDDEGLLQLQDLFLADAEMAAQLPDVIALGGGPLDMRELPFPALVIVTNILQFWYLGHFRNEPLPNRAERLGTLVAYQAPPYVTIPAVCKAFGYWTADPGITGQEQ